VEVKINSQERTHAIDSHQRGRESRLRILASLGFRLWVPAVVVALLCQTLGAWGEKGHLAINRLALEASQKELPPFMAAARRQIVYDAYEPDRWREEIDTPLNAAQTLDHFFDSELWGNISTLEPNRFAFMEKLVERKTGLTRVGYLPYSIMENYGRLRNAFRQYRKAKTPEDRESAQANAIHYAGVLGHYVGDGSMPMHLSIHFNGWADGAPNPQGYTLDRTFHSRYENDYVNAAISDALVRPLVRAPQRLPNVFAAVKDYLQQAFNELEPIYRLEKLGEFHPDAPKERGTQMISSQLARASQTLGSLWYTAWVESGEQP